MTYEHDRALMEGARNSACDDYFSARPQIDTIDRRRVYEAGFQAGAASRDAEVAQWQRIIDEEAKDSALVIIERDQLRAQINVLRDAFQTFIDEHEECQDADEWMAELCSIEALHVAGEALASTTKQSLAEYRNKVIEECAAVLNVAITRLSSCGASIKNDVAISTLKEQSCRLRAMKEQP